MKRAMVFRILMVGLIVFCLFSIVNDCYAFAPLLEAGEKQYEQEEAFRQEAGFSEDVTVGDVVGMAISAFLGFLGTVFLVLMVIGGWKYMMARGNEEQVTEALGLIRRAIIGLIIVAGAYSITYFVFNAIDWVGGGGGGSGINATSDF